MLNVAVSLIFKASQVMAYDMSGVFVVLISLFLIINIHVKVFGKIKEKKSGRRRNNG